MPQQTQSQDSQFGKARSWGAPSQQAIRITGLAISNPKELLRRLGMTAMSDTGSNLNNMKLVVAKFAGLDGSKPWDGEVATAFDSITATGNLLIVKLRVITTDQGTNRTIVSTGTMARFIKALLLACDSVKTIKFDVNQPKAIVSYPQSANVVVTVSSQAGVVKSVPK